MDNFKFWVYMCINTLATKGLHIPASLIHTSNLQKATVASHSAQDERKNTKEILTSYRGQSWN